MAYGDGAPALDGDGTRLVLLKLPGGAGGAAAGGGGGAAAGGGAGPLPYESMLVDRFCPYAADGGSGGRLTLWGAGGIGGRLKEEEDP